MKPLEEMLPFSLVKLERAHRVGLKTLSHTKLFVVRFENMIIATQY